MKNPPTLKQAEAYAKLRNLAVNVADFIMHYEDADPPWTKKPKKGKEVGETVLNWKQTMQTWHRRELKWGGMPKCDYGGWDGTCKKPGVYIVGKDRDGHPYRYCIDHKPKPKPLLPKEMTNVIKIVPEGDRSSTSDKANKARRKLGDL